jgi:tRNA pseudouridine55 synthase
MDGIILIDKPAGPASAEVVRKIKARIASRKPAPRVGHLGTLDPFATGLLPIMVGEGTKLAPFIQSGDKEYEGTIAFGIETDTLDATGTTVRTAPLPELSSESLEEVTAQFSGSVEQVPPVFSAIKRAGVPLYKLARRGVEVAPPAPRTVEIKRLELRVLDESHLEFRVVCSTGTYIRSLARDIGEKLGTAAHLGSLRRLRSGHFKINQAHPFEQVLRQLDTGVELEIISLSDALALLPEVEIDSERERQLRRGDARALDFLAPPGASLFKVVAQGELVAIGEATSRVTAKIARVFNTRAPESSQIGMR